MAKAKKQPTTTVNDEALATAPAAGNGNGNDGASTDKSNTNDTTTPEAGNPFPREIISMGSRPEPKAPATTGKTPDISADIYKGVLTFTFSDGRTIEIDSAKLKPEIQHQALMHGLKQKLIDAAAIARDTVNGRSATLNDKYAAIEDVRARLTHETNPQWNKVREAGNGGAGNSNLLIRALMEFSGKGKAAIEEFVAAKSKEQIAALRKNPKVAEIIVRLQAESADSTIDTDAMLGELAFNRRKGDVRGE